MTVRCACNQNVRRAPLSGWQGSEEAQCSPGWMCVVDAVTAVPKASDHGKLAKLFPHVSEAQMGSKPSSGSMSKCQACTKPSNCSFRHQLLTAWDCLPTKSSYWEQLTPPWGWTNWTRWGSGLQRQQVFPQSVHTSPASSFAVRVSVCLCVCSSSFPCHL